MSETQKADSPKPESVPDPGRGAEKITLRLSSDARETLEWIAAHYDCSLAEAMRRALGTERYLLEQKVKGATLLIEDRPGARQRELILR